MNKRVVVTGMGAVTPVGNDVAAFWDGLISGKNGIDFITKFDTSNVKVKLAAEVKDFHPEDYMEKSLIRKTDLYCHYAMAAASQAMEDSGIAGKVDPERLGVYVSSGIGGMKTFFGRMHQVDQHRRQKGFPVLYSKTDCEYCGGQHCNCP